MTAPKTIPWSRAFAAWLAIIAVETLHGVVRRITLVPWLGDLHSRQVGVVIGSALIFVVAWACIRWIGTRRTGELFAVGALWVVLTLLFEFALGMALGYSRERMLADYDAARGGWLGAGMLFLLCAPWLAARARGVRAVPAAARTGERP